MKKYIALVLSLLLITAMMAGCNTTPTEPSETTPTENKEAVTYVYGTARLTWAQFWANEDITYDDSMAFDAVTRATHKHGVYRGSAHYSSLLHAVDEAGNEVSVHLEDMTDAANVEDMYGVESVFYGLADGTYCLAQPESEATAYTVTGVEIVGYKAWPVKVPADQAEAAAEAINFVEDASVTEETSLLKTVTVVDGQVNASAAAAASGTAVEYTGEVSVSYNDKYGDYIFVQLSGCPEDWGMNLLGATYLTTLM